MDSISTTAAGLRYVQVDAETNRELLRRGVCEGAARLYFYILVHARRTGESFASHQYLAAEVGKSVRTIGSYVQQLRNAGALESTRTGRAARYRPLRITPESPCRSATCCRSQNTEVLGELERESVVTATEPPAPTVDELTTTTLSRSEVDELPVASEARSDLASARDRAAEWQRSAPDAPETTQSRQRVQALHHRLEQLEDVDRAAEALSTIDGYRAHRGDGGVRSRADLWRLRQAYASMDSSTWRRSVRAWCAYHRRRSGRLRSLDGWLARERHEEIDPPQLVPLPDPPPVHADNDTIDATTDEPVDVYVCATAAGGCQFLRMVVPAGSEPPERCPRCGGRVKTAGL